MSQEIKRLSEYVSNQIAAGEVVLGPSSVVKELMENSVDAGAELIIVSIKGAGSDLIQIVDDGKGMSPQDAVGCFERHATSKIADINDIYSLSTFGFRGEALASIAAVAEVELHTRQEQDDLGYCVYISGGVISNQQEVAAAKGSQFIVKNLFYNIPARRNFLKTPRTEMKKIIEEFQRVALCYPRITFFLYEDDQCLYNLPAGALRQRVLAISGKQVNSSLLEVYVESSIVEIRGYIGKPEAARKNAPRNMFINGRYFWDSYLNKAILLAYEKLLNQAGTTPPYFLYFTVDPASIDVNVSPSKTEVKFDNHQSVFQILLCAVKESLGKNGIVPMIDFDAGEGLEIPIFDQSDAPSAPQIELSSGPYNPFDEGFSFSRAVSGVDNSFRANILSEERTTTASSVWDGNSFEEQGSEMIQSDVDSLSYIEIDASMDDFAGEEEPDYLFNDTSSSNSSNSSSSSFSTKVSYTEVASSIQSTLPIEGLQRGGQMAWGSKYIVANVSGRILFINAARARMRIFYDKLMQRMAIRPQQECQQLLFPVMVDLTVPDMRIANECKKELLELGFGYECGPNGQVTITAVPASIDSTDVEQIFDDVLQSVKTEEDNVYAKAIKEKFAMGLARSASRMSKDQLSSNEAAQIVDQLLECVDLSYSPDGKKIYSSVSIDDIDKLLK